MGIGQAAEDEFHVIRSTAPSKPRPPTSCPAGVWSSGSAVAPSRLSVTASACRWRRTFDQGSRPARDEVERAMRRFAEQVMPKLTRQWQRVREFLADWDLLVTPTTAVPPFPFEHPHVIEVNGRPVGKAMARSFLTYAFSMLGLPAISIPCGFTSGGLPVELQIAGKRRAEAAVLRAAAAFEAAQPWADQIPPVVASSR